MNVSRDVASGLPGGRILTSLYTHNPFYLISAFLMLLGVEQAFRPAPGELINPWALLAALCGYIALMAVTAWFIVRRGRVWEDARSIVLVLLLLFVSLSISFDEIVNLSPPAGLALLCSGFAFCTLVTEALLTGLGIRWGVLLRGPYYLLLVLFFAFPLWVSPEVTEASAQTIRWRILLFPAAAALAALLLIPAARRGAAYVERNGTPWSWPWFPWTVFAFLGIAVCIRSYVLSVSFDPSSGYESAFAWFSLIPFFGAVLVLLLEIGLESASRKLQLGTLAVAALLLVLAWPGLRQGTNYEAFVADVLQKGGSPLWITLIGMIAFYGYAWLRGVTWAEAGMMAGLALLSCTGAETVDLETAIAARVWPLATIAAIQLVRAAARPSSWRWFAALCLLNLAASTSLSNFGLVANARLLAYVLLVASMLVVGAAFRDRLARMLRVSGLVLLAGACVLLIAPESAGLRLAGHRQALSLGALTAAAFGYWLAVRDFRSLVTAVICLACCGVSASLAVRGTVVRVASVRGVQPVAWAAGSFCLAVGISAAKARRQQSREHGDDSELEHPLP